MKKTFANLVQKSLVAALLVFGALLFSTSRAEAQGGAKNLGVNWVDAGEAMLRLQTDVENLHNDPQVNSVGSDSYIRVRYYKAVYRRIGSGEPIVYAVVTALGVTPSSSDLVNQNDIPGVTLTQAQANNLLTTITSRLSL